MEDMDIIKFMIDSFNQENRDLCEKSGMSPEAIDSAIEQSQGSLEYMFKNLYFKMKEQGLINQP